MLSRIPRPGLGLSMCLYRRSRTLRRPTRLRRPLTSLSPVELSSFISRSKLTRLLLLLACHAFHRKILDKALALAQYGSAREAKFAARLIAFSKRSDELSEKLAEVRAGSSHGGLLNLS